MVETGGLENRFTRKGNGGSNPSPSATPLKLASYVATSALSDLQMIVKTEIACDLRAFWPCMPGVAPHQFAADLRI